MSVLFSFDTVDGYYEGYFQYLIGLDICFDIFLRICALITIMWIFRFNDNAYDSSGEANLNYNKMYYKNVSAEDEILIGFCFVLYKACIPCGFILKRIAGSQVFKNERKSCVSVITAALTLVPNSWLAFRL